METSTPCRLCGKTVDMTSGSTYYRPIPQLVEKRYIGVVCCSRDHANQIEKRYPQLISKGENL